MRSMRSCAGDWSYRARTACPSSVLSSRSLATWRQSHASLAIASTRGGELVTGVTCAEALVAANSSTSAPVVEKFICAQRSAPDDLSRAATVGREDGMLRRRATRWDVAAHRAPPAHTGKHRDRAHRMARPRSGVLPNDLPRRGLLCRAALPLPRHWPRVLRPGGAR